MPSLHRLIDNLFLETNDQELAEALARLLLPILMAKPADQPDPGKPFLIRYTGQDGHAKNVNLVGSTISAPYPDMSEPKYHTTERGSEDPTPWLTPITVSPPPEDDE